MSRLKTLVRVAELQEAVARGHVAKALLAARAAEQVQAEQLRMLRASRLEGGSREELSRSAAQQQYLAAGVVEADNAAALAAATQGEAVAQWTATRRRRKLFTELAERKREERAAALERQEQRLADELASSRAARR